MLGDVPATTAILDRFLAHAEIIQMQGKSYRLHHRAERASRAQGKRDEREHGVQAEIQGSQTLGATEIVAPRRSYDLEFQTCWANTAQKGFHHLDAVGTASSRRLHKGR